MREVSQVFQEGFINGLRISKSLGPSTQYLLQSLNLVPTKAGLEPRQAITNPIDIAETSYPFPALFVLSRYTLLFTKNSLYLVDATWELTFLATVEWGDLPHIADFMDYVVIATPNGQWSFDGTTLTPITDATFSTCVNFRGQLIVGAATLPKGPAKVGNEVIPSQVPVGGSNTVAWTKIGSLEWEYTLGNEVGWAPMPWNGSILGLLPLGKEVVVYGDTGICKMSMVAEPVTTFGGQDFGDVGVLNRNCFAGDTTAHVFVGTDYALYKVEPEKALSGEGKLPLRLGYEEWISKLNNPVMTFDTTRRHWWVGDTERCFILTDTGLGESSETPTHLSRLDNQLLGIPFPHHDSEAIVETGFISFDSRGFKTLTCVEADVTSDRLVFGSTSALYTYNSTVFTSDETVLDPRGAFFPTVTGTELSVKLRSVDYQNFYLTKMWLHFKNSDKTFSRGIINAGRPAE